MSSDDAEFAPAGAESISPGAGGGAVALPDLGERLGLSTKVFRAYLEEFGDLLVVWEERGDKLLTRDDAFLLERIHKFAQIGLTAEEIRKELGSTVEANSPVEAEEDTSVAGEGIEDADPLLHEILQRLDRIEDRRMEDRDKLMLTLIRTQKEIQQLRYELAAREGRRRGGFFSRLFGR